VPIIKVPITFPSCSCWWRTSGSTWAQTSGTPTQRWRQFPKGERWAKCRLTGSHGTSSPRCSGSWARVLSMKTFSG